MSYKAVHVPGGNFFDDVRLDLSASFAAQDVWLSTSGKVSVPGSRVQAAARRAAYRAEPYRVREALVNAGIRRAWFEEFRAYWEGVLDGRPLTVMDFHNLRFLYRQRAAREIERLAWSDPESHLANWQLPHNLYHTFDFVYRSALHPIAGGRLVLDLISRRSRVLEYGCGIAPAYRTWRAFVSFVRSEWVLADIPGFAFHYTRHVFGRDDGAHLVVIEDFEDPLAGVAGGFDLIFVQTVLEHLDHPRRVAEYLVERLNPSGLLVFDYIRTRGKGLDTPSGVEERRATLEYLAQQLTIVKGDFHVDDHSLGTCVGRRRT